MMNFIRNRNLYLPVAIVVGCIVLGAVFYLIQIDKRESIERQQAEQAAYEQKQDELAVKRAECESLSSGVKKRWNNVLGVTYEDSFWIKGCVVTYTDTKTGEVQTAPLESMKDVN